MFSSSRCRYVVQLRRKSIFNRGGAEHAENSGYLSSWASPPPAAGRCDDLFISFSAVLIVRFMFFLHRFAGLMFHKYGDVFITVFKAMA